MVLWNFATIMITFKPIISYMNLCFYGFNLCQHQVTYKKQKKIKYTLMHLDLF